MRTLKRIIYVYEEAVVIKGHNFNYETTKYVKKHKKPESLYALYDSGKYGRLIASTILSYEGLNEIAEAYLTGDKQALEEAKKKWCICY